MGGHSTSRGSLGGEYAVIIFYRGICDPTAFGSWPITKLTSTDIIHATNFIIDADKRVTQACFATGPIGRIVAEDALRSIQGTKKRKAQGS